MPGEIEGVIFDVDGVLVYQGTVYPGAVEVIDELRDRGIILRFLTNSTLKSRRSCAEGLRKKGFLVLDEEVITASYATAAYLRGLKPRSVWVMAEREGLEEFEDFRQDLEEPEYVVIGDNRSNFDFDHLNQALRLLLKGAKLIGMQAELTDTSLGEPELNVGAWVGMLERAAGVTAVYVGKPNPYVFDLTMESMGLDKRAVVMVGDRPSTDVKGAHDYGIRSALVTTGEFDERELDGSVEPDYWLESIADVLAVWEA
jgi:HAD superfamily hydrolase (TIGR01458 family)